jgi:hypothetical protein
MNSVPMTKLTCIVNCGNKHSDDGLNRLAMKRKVTFYEISEVSLTGPFGMVETHLFMLFRAAIPDVCSFHLRCFCYLKLASRQVFKPIHSYGFHATIVAWISQFGNCRSQVYPYLNSATKREMTLYAYSCCRR